ncbi:hypothetical protein V8D89_006739 [Ganoderma adspersum]
MPADNEDTRPPKRPRTAEETLSEFLTTNAPSASDGHLNRDLNLTRHEDLWFDDGSVVLLARETGFRVFRSLLAVHSTVFADMFSKSSSSNAEMFEGCPVIHLSDSPEDVTHFLRVLFPTELSQQTRILDFHQISAIIRLAHKYNFPDLLDQTITLLQQHFTSDFDIWNDNPVQYASESIAVINLARLVGIPSLLPSAFYMCAALHGAILDGFEREDKSVEYLSQEDVKRCMNGWNKLVEASLALIVHIFSLTANPSRADACDRRIKCPVALHAMMGDAVAECMQSSVSALASWGPFIQHNFPRDVQLCENCKQAAVDRDYTARRRLWEELPAIFDIEVDGWPSSPGGGDGDNVVSATT